MFVCARRDGKPVYINSVFQALARRWSPLFRGLIELARETDARKRKGIIDRVQTLSVQLLLERPAREVIRGSPRGFLPLQRATTSIHPLRRPRLDVLHDRHGALADERDGHRVGADAVACDATGSVGGAHQGRRGMARPRPEKKKPGPAAPLRLEVRQTQPGTIQADHPFLLTVRPDTASGIGGHQISPAPRHGPAG